jgi:RHS repeat-associated protein
MSYSKDPSTDQLKVMEENHYYPFGLKHMNYNKERRYFEKDLSNSFNIRALLEGGLEYNYRYGGKEYKDELGLNMYDFGSRNYDASLGRWMNIDPLADNIHNMDFSPYNYVKNNPIVFLDPNGEDWFYYKKEGETEASWNWQKGSTYNHKYSYVDKDGKKQNKTIELDGVEAVVVFNGSRDEKLGEGKSLFGKGANLAKVTVYGPDGADDIKTYDGFSMGSDSKKFGAIEDGTYDFNYDAAGKSGKLKSHWAVEGRGNVPALDGYNPNPNATTDRRFKNGIFIHTSNQSGFAGAYNKGKNGISEGCLLIVPSLYDKQGNSTNNGWNQFNEQLQGVKKGVLQVIRK